MFYSHDERKSRDGHIGEAASGAYDAPVVRGNRPDYPGFLPGFNRRNRPVAPVDHEWAAFVAAPPPVRRIAEDWLAGLARNPAASVSLLARLLRTDAFLHVLYRPDLPPEIVNVATMHESERVRWHVWETQPLSNRPVRATHDWRWRQFMVMQGQSEADQLRRPGYREPEPRRETRPPGVPDEVAAAETEALSAPELIRLLTTVTEARHRPHNITVAAARNPAIPVGVMDHMVTAAIRALAPAPGDV